MTIEARIKIAIKCEMGNQKVFERLEAESQIGSGSWKAMLYGKQRATSEMIQFICLNFPNLVFWMMVGTTPKDMPMQKEPAELMAEKHGLKLDEVLRKPASELCATEILILGMHFPVLQPLK